LEIVWFEPIGRFICFFLISIEGGYIEEPRLASKTVGVCKELDIERFFECWKGG